MGLKWVYLDWWVLCFVSLGLAARSLPPPPPASDSNYPNRHGYKGKGVMHCDKEVFQTVENHHLDWKKLLIMGVRILPGIAEDYPHFTVWDSGYYRRHYHWALRFVQVKKNGSNLKIVKDSLIMYWRGCEFLSWPLAWIRILSGTVEGKILELVDMDRYF